MATGAQLMWLLLAFLLLAGPASAQDLFPLQRTAGPAVVQSQSTYFYGAFQCAWSVPAIGSGNTVVGFVHSTDLTDSFEEYPQSVTDDAGNTYNLSQGVHWKPYPEDIGIWYLTNVKGSPKTIYFNFSYRQNYCNVGFVEYSDVQGITVAGPVDDNAAGPMPSLPITPPAQSLIWTLGATNSATDGSDLKTSSYSVLINDQAHNGIAVWGSNSPVPAGSTTLKWSNPYWNATTCQDGTQTTTGCSVVMIAAAVH